jgi:hypothetical protein
VLRLAAQHIRGLRRLTCPWVKDATFSEQLPSQQADGALEQPLPAAALGILTSLQHLDVGRYLRISQAGHWAALRRLTALTTLRGVLVEGGPPAGWRHSGVQQLGAVVRLPGEEAAAAACVLSFPTAQVADLRGAAGGGVVVYQLPPLSGMGSLQELLVDGSTAPPAAAAAAAGAAGSMGLPSSLGRLQVEGSAAGWLQHLPATPHLTELQYGYDGEQHASAHPAAVLELAARHTRGLRSLTCFRATTITSSSSTTSSSSGTWKGQEGAPQQQPPPEEQQQHPPAGVALAALTSLRHINAGGYLYVGRASHWQALGHLSALSSLQGVVVCQAPPHSWRHRHVQQLAVVLDGMGGWEAAQVLLAFPSLKQAQVCVVGAPGEQQPARGAVAGSEQQQGVPPVLALLTSLQLEYPAGRYEGSMSPAAHAAPMLAAARGVEDLRFEGECSHQGGAPLLLDLSGVTGVTRLRFGRSQVWNQAATVEDVVAMVQPLGRMLRVLELSHMRGIGPEAVLELQQVLPRLRHVVMGPFGFVWRDEGELWRYVEANLRGDVTVTLTSRSGRNQYQMYC